MAYSIDFKRRALGYMEEGHSYKELYEAFKIYASDIARWRRSLEETGTLEPQYPKTRAGKINLERLEEAIKEKPDAYLCELAKEFGCTKQAVFVALKKLKITVKKRLFHTQRKVS
jgi:transposase